MIQCTELAFSALVESDVLFFGLLERGAFCAGNLYLDGIGDPLPSRGLPVILSKSQFVKCSSKRSSNLFDSISMCAKLSASFYTPIKK